MAYLETIEEEENRPKGSIPGGTAVTSGGGIRPVDRTSGSWTNLQDYIRSNKSQAEQMAGKIGAGIEQERQGYGKQVSQAEQNYQSYLDNLKKTAEGKREFAQRVSSGETPTTQEIYEQVQQGLFTPGQSPEAFEVYNPEVLQKQQALQQKLSETETEAGRQAYLKNIQSPRVTRGESLLDQFLMQSTPAAKQMFEQQRQIGTGGYLSSTQQEAQARMQALQQFQQATPEYMGEQFKGASETSQKKIDKYKSDIQNIQNIIKDLTKYDVRGRLPRNANAQYTHEMLKLLIAYSKAGIVPPDFLYHPNNRPTRQSVPGVPVLGSQGPVDAYDYLMEFIGPRGQLGQYQMKLPQEQARLDALQQMSGYLPQK